ncbi:MAG: putative signal transducing protein [Aequorivita sp.]
MSDNLEETTRIYTGSDIMAEALVGRLQEAGITPILRDDQQNAVMFGSGNNYSDQIRVFVRKDELAVAQPIAEAFKAETRD